MTILEKVKQYYHSNSTDLNSFLEETFFLETTPEYPNSVVIKFGLHKLFGEVSVWQHADESYMEFEYVDLGKDNQEPVCISRTIDAETVNDELAKQFDVLRQLVNHRLIGNS
jgi:hypothetical protein